MRCTFHRVEIICSRANRICKATEFVIKNKANEIMKRTRIIAKSQEQNALKNQNEEKTTKIPMMPKVILNERPKLNLKSLRSRNVGNIHNGIEPLINISSKNQKEEEMEIVIKREELKSNTNPGKGKRRAVVDLHIMKKELSHLEDPPVTPWEKELSSNRLQYEFFDIPCEELAQQLLGKILVRYLENGTLLKGRIVETEAYLGAIDKASQSYQNKITPRNLPMYMPPGTVYVYMTYGMYHCFNISSQETNAHVLIRAVEPLVGLEYMELLRNMQRKDNGREKQIAKFATCLKQYELCNNPFKICDAFAIDQDIFNQKLAYACSNLWLENQPFVRPPTIVAVPPKDHALNNNCGKKTRYYVLGSTSVNARDGCAVLVRAVDPLEGMEHMADQRKTAKKGNLKQHELCNGPSKLCMAYQLDRQHSKYSVCTWKALWIENDNALSNFKIVKSARIGIDSCGPEWASKPLRYYIYANKSVSKRNKKAEMDIF